MRNEQQVSSCNPRLDGEYVVNDNKTEKNCQKLTVSDKVLRLASGDFNTEATQTHVKTGEEKGVIFTPRH